MGEAEKSYRVNIDIHGLFRAWVKKHRRLVLVAASLAGGGAIVYYGTEALGLVSRVKTKKEKDPARSTILQNEAEDRADTQYICCLPVLDRIIDYMKLLEEDIIGVSYTRFLVYDAVKCVWEQNIFFFLSYPSQQLCFLMYICKGLLRFIGGANCIRKLVAWLLCKFSCSNIYDICRSKKVVRFQC